MVLNTFKWVHPPFGRTLDSAQSQPMPFVMA